METSRARTHLCHGGTKHEMGDVVGCVRAEKHLVKSTLCHLCSQWEKVLWAWFAATFLMPSA